MSLVKILHEEHVARLARFAAAVKPPTPEPEPVPEPPAPEPKIKRDYLRVATPSSVVTSRQILAAVCKRFTVSDELIKSKHRTNDIVRARQISMYLMRRCTTLSQPNIGRLLGGKDHTTVLHAVNQIERLRRGDRDVGRCIDELIHELGLTERPANNSASA